MYNKNKLMTKLRESAPDYDFDDENIPCYIYDSEESQMVNLNTLSFQYTFEHDNDIVFFSHFNPIHTRILKIISI